jgi:hypothetical protein
LEWGSLRSRSSTTVAAARAGFDMLDPFNRVRVCHKSRSAPRYRAVCPTRRSHPSIIDEPLFLHVIRTWERMMLAKAGAASYTRALTAGS